MLRIFADAADASMMSVLARDGRISGFTTNPSLVSRAGVKNYRRFAHRVLDAVGDHPVSFEVLSDDVGEMVSQARVISSWGENVYVKIPAVTVDRGSTAAYVRRLSGDGVRVNVTAILDHRQVEEAAAALGGGAPGFVSVFAGRIADTGRDPIPAMIRAVDALRDAPNAKLIWASAREVLNVVQADRAGCDVITLTPDLIAKLDLFDADLFERSVTTVREFSEAARELRL